MFDKQEIINMLRTGIVRVVFEKVVTKEQRVMMATLKEDLIPIKENPPQPGRKISEEILRVFDVEKNAWRSFRLDSLREVRFNG